MVSAIWVPQSLAQVLPDLASFWPMGKPIWGKWVNNYDVAQLQVYWTLNGVNPSSSFRDIRSGKAGPNLWKIWQVFGPWASPYWANGQMTRPVHNYRPRQFHRTSNGENPQAVTEIWVPQVWQPPACPPARTVKIPLQPEGLRVNKTWKLRIILGICVYEKPAVLHQKETQLIFMIRGTYIS